MYESNSDVYFLPNGFYEATVLSGFIDGRYGSLTICSYIQNVLFHFKYKIMQNRDISDLELAREYENIYYGFKCFPKTPAYDIIDTNFCKHRQVPEFLVSDNKEIIDRFRIIRIRMYHLERRRSRIGRGFTERLIREYFK